MPSVFWSWQSDAPYRETRGIIKEALEIAVADLNASVDAAERPDSALTLDHDTKGLSGSPDIVTSILRKIEEATAFVADVTPIGVVTTRDTLRHVQNPNVLIELGYAKKALGLARVIQVWNTAITGCSVENLPFDMRGRRGPISFQLAVGASTDEYREARAHLSKMLLGALSAISPSSSNDDTWPAWRDSNPQNPAIWFEEGSSLTVNEPHHGSGEKIFPSAPTQYARLLPSRWDKPSDPPHSHMLGHTSGFSWGRTTGGLLTYSGSIVRPELADSTNGTILFYDTGEVWSIDRWVVHEWRGKQMFLGDDMFKGLVSFLSDQIKQMLENGATLPFKVKLGATGLSGSFWPLANPFFGEPAALENAVEIEQSLHGGSREELEQIVVSYWTAVRDAFGMSPPDQGSISKAMQYYRD